MPEKRLSRVRIMKEIERVCTEQAENVFRSILMPALQDRGYELIRVLDGLVTKEESDKIREQLLREERVSDYSNLLIYDEENGTQSIAYFVVRHITKGYCALIEATFGAIILVKDNDIMIEMERFAEAWEKERSVLRERLGTEFHEHLHALGYRCQDFAETVTIIEA